MAVISHAELMRMIATSQAEQRENDPNCKLTQEEKARLAQFSNMLCDIVNEHLPPFNKTEETNE